MFIVPSLEDIRQAILRDVQSLEPSADVSIDSDYYARASSLAAVAEGIYAHQNGLLNNSFPILPTQIFLKNMLACVVFAVVMRLMLVGVAQQ